MKRKLWNCEIMGIQAEKFVRNLVSIKNNTRISLLDITKKAKLAAGISLKEKGRPPKIKSLEMENELMRDFLSLTERK